MADDARPAPAPVEKPWRKLAAVWAVSTVVALGLYFGYRHLFPYRSVAQGICLACGAQTRLGPRGWADFCPRHNPLTPLPPLMVIGETLSLLVSAICGWLILRRFARWGGRTVSLGLVLLCVALMALYVLAAPEPLHMMHHFALALFLLVYALSAAYVDSVESLIIVATVALGGAALLCVVIQVMTWVVMGYLGMFASQ